MVSLTEADLRRVELEPRPLREHPRPSLKSTTESNLKIFIKCRLTNDFHTNKRIIDDIAIIQSKRLRNKIAGKISILTQANRFHHPHDEENPKGTRQGHLTQAPRRGKLSLNAFQSI